MTRKEKLRLILEKDCSELGEEEKSFLKLNAQFLSENERSKFSSVLQRRLLNVGERTELRRLMLLDKLYPRPDDWEQSDEAKEAREDGVVPALIARTK